MTTTAPPPPAPASPPPPLSSGGRTAIRVVLIVAAAVLVLCTVGALTALAIGVGTTRVITDSRALPTNMRTLTVDAEHAALGVRITTDPKATTPRADIRMIGSTSVGDHRFDVVTDGDRARLTISGRSAPSFEWAAGEITMVLPPDVARRLSVTTNQKNGSVSADADLDQLTVQGTNGAVQLRGSARRVEVHLRNGSVTTDRPISVAESFTVTTVNGEIDAEFKGAPPRSIDASSRNGDVKVALAAPGPYLVNADTGKDHDDADVTVAQTSNPAAAASEVTARSENGDVTVENLR